MIAECAQDLFEKINGCPALTGKVGISLGGNKADPSNSRVALPCAWVFPAWMSPAEPAGFVADETRDFHSSFLVTLLIPYTSQAEMVSTNFPLIRQVIKAVQGTRAPTQSNWSFEGYQCKQVNPDRLSYELVFETIDCI